MAHTTTRFGHAHDQRASPSERKAEVGTMKTKSVIDHLRAIDRSDQADELSDTLLRRYAESKRAQGMKEEDIEKRLRAIEGMVQQRDDHRGSCVDFTDALMSFTVPACQPPRPSLYLDSFDPPSKGFSHPLGPKRTLYPSPTSPLHVPIYTPQKATPGTSTSPPSPALSNLITPPTPRIGLPLPKIITPTPPTPTRPRRRRLKASISSIETITNAPRTREPIPSLSFPRLPCLVKGDDFDFNLDLFSPRPTPGPTDAFFPSDPVAPPLTQGSQSRAGTRASILFSVDIERLDDEDGSLLDAFPLPPPRPSTNDEASGVSVPGRSPGSSSIRRPITPDVSRDPFYRPRNPYPDTPETIRPAPNQRKPTRSMSLEDMWWDDESDAQTVTAATPSTQRTFLSNDGSWSAPCEDHPGLIASALTSPSAASLIRDEYLKARIKDSRCSIESFSQGDPYIRATLSAMAAHGRA